MGVKTLSHEAIYLSDRIFINARNDGIIEIRDTQPSAQDKILDKINYLTARDSFGMAVMQILPSLTFQEVHSVQQRLNVLYHF